MTLALCLCIIALTVIIGRIYMLCWNEIVLYRLYSNFLKIAISWVNEIYVSIVCCINSLVMSSWVYLISCMLHHSAVMFSATTYMCIWTHVAVLSCDVTWCDIPDKPLPVIPYRLLRVIPRCQCTYYVCRLTGVKQ